MSWLKWRLFSSVLGCFITSLSLSAAFCLLMILHMLSSYRYRIVLFEPAHENMVLFVLRNLKFQTRMRGHPMGLHVWFFVGPIVYFHTLCVRTAKALMRLRGCAGSPQPSLVAYVINIIISWTGSFILFSFVFIFWFRTRIQGMKLFELNANFRSSISARNETSYSISVSVSCFSLQMLVGLQFIVDVLFKKKKEKKKQTCPRLILRENERCQN